MREVRGTITWVLSKPSRLGTRISRSGLPPVTQAVVTCLRPAAQPEEISPHSAPVTAARRRPTASASSSYCTKKPWAASMAATTSASSTEPPMMVKVPRQLMTGSTPMAS